MLLFFLVTAGVILLDQVTKILALGYLAPAGSYPLWENVLHLTYVENTGAAFGMLKDHRWVFLVCSVVGIGLVGFYLFRYVGRPLSRVALALIIGGGIGNMIDRVRLGFVVDFIDFCAFDFWVWVFNVADAAVCVGAALFVLDLLIELIEDLRHKKQGVPVEPQTAEPSEGDNG